MPIRFQVDPDFYDHPKTIDASDAAVALWTRAGSYSTAKLLDGFVPENALGLLSKVPDVAAAELVSRRLWRRVKGGYRFHQWEARNLTRARVEADKESDRERKRRERIAARQNATPQVNGHSVQPDSSPDSGGIPNGVHPLSVSVLVSGSESGSGRHPPSRTCPQHPKGTKDSCGACASAREAFEADQADTRERQRLAAKCRLHRGELAHNCRICAAEELSPA